jgi:hypothetical protein
MLRVVMLTGFVVAALMGSPEPARAAVTSEWSCDRASR